MMPRERKLQLLRSVFQKHGTIQKNDEIAFFCLRHDANPGRSIGQLNINLESDFFHCWSCGFSGRNLASLFPKGSQERREYVGSLPELKRPAPEIEKKYDDPFLPEEFRTLSRSWHGPYYGKAIEYLTNRGVDKYDIIRWKLGYCEDGEYRDRIIIPSFDEFGSLNFFVGRSFFDDPKKYKSGNFCKDVIFNDYMINWDRPVVVTEGPFDAIKAEDNVVALYGNALRNTTKLFFKIVMSGVDVYFAMDSDAFDRQLTIIEELVSYGVNCFYVDLAGRKDVGDMTKNEFIVAKNNAFSVKNQADVMKMRVMS